MIRKFLYTPFRINVLLFLCSFIIYFIYFHPVFLHLNTVLSSVSGDSLKNYYTYMYHIKHDAGALHFEGLNFPYGEHIVYTDCQPLLTFILRCLPFTHNYLIGILHALLFLSFIVTPLLLNQIFIRLKLDRFFSFFVSLAVTLLSPQYFKILGGHYALAYGCIIPACILLLLNFFQKPGRLKLFRIFLFNLCLFFLHPYFGFGSSLFCFISLISFAFLNYKKGLILQTTGKAFLAGILPILLFKLFMVISDQHINRTNEPENVNSLIANPGSLLLPVFGPFREFLSHLFKVEASNFEGFCYLGIFFIGLCILFPVLLLITRKKTLITKESAAIFISSLVLLFFAFGLHNILLALLHIRIAALDQFRASGRFIWFFYYGVAVFLIPTLYLSLKNYRTSAAMTVGLKIAAVLYFAFNLLEADALFKLDRHAFWKFTNFFNENCLSEQERGFIRQLENQELQAIIPLPLYHSGSEVYSRSENGSMLPSMLYSYHCHLPVLSSFLSRTSVSETEEVIQVLNSYKKHHDISPFLNKKNFLVLRNDEALMPDEERLFKKTHFVFRDKTIEAGILQEKDLFKKAYDDSVSIVHLPVRPDNNFSNVIFISRENRKPFLQSNMNDYEIIYKLDSNRVKSGVYVLSLHFYYTQKTHRDIACNIIINEWNAQKAEWIENMPLKYFSGFYPGYAVFEKKITIDRHSNYEFILKGLNDKNYRISDFMIRPEHTTVLLINGKDTIANNFPD